MAQYYLMIDKIARDDFDTHSEQILRYICDTLLIDVSPCSSLHNIRTIEKNRFVTIKKLTSRTWQEYLSDAMKQISESEFVIRIELDPNNGCYLQDIILEKYCELTGVKVHTIRIDENTWRRICNGGLPRFVYSKLPDAENWDKSENWKE